MPDYIYTGESRLMKYQITVETEKICLADFERDIRSRFIRDDYNDLKIISVDLAIQETKDE